MAKIRRKVLIVQGSGMFPIDMLRYDHCWPRTEEDSNKIAASYWDDKNTPELRTVSLLSDMEYVTPARWESFTWKLVKWDYAR